MAPPASSPSLERRERERLTTRRKILEAARRMFVQRGYEGTTMRAIAAKIGYTPTAIYHHFKDKDELVAELTALDFQAFAQALRSTGTEGDPVERLGKIGEAYVDFGLTHPMQYQFIFMMPRPEHAPNTVAADAYGFLRQTCADVIATGRLRPEFTDPDELAQMAWSSVHGLVALQIVKGEDARFNWRDARGTRAKLRDALWHGLLRGTER
ncbi:MAG TPA: TetR/AcrR family transcriptional regulator [Gemmatimonadales bacterium]|nr:TetR/AcrR family transcriptional regulator [Gemmatimonadales bacterium]